MLTPSLHNNTRAMACSRGSNAASAPQQLPAHPKPRKQDQSARRTCRLLPEGAATIDHTNSAAAAAPFASCVLAPQQHNFACQHASQLATQHQRQAGPDAPLLQHTQHSVVTHTKHSRHTSWVQKSRPVCAPTHPVDRRAPLRGRQPDAPDTPPNTRSCARSAQLAAPAAAFCCCSNCRNISSRDLSCSYACTTCCTSC